MHVTNKAQVLAVLARLADGTPPFFNQFQDLVLHTGIANRRALREAPHELVQEILGGDLQVERISTVFDADVQEREG